MRSTRSKTSSGIPYQATSRPKRSEVSTLCAALFGATPLAAPCHTWAVANPRFAAFLDTYQGKIGKKLRGIDSESGYLDLLAELEVAHRLLADRGFTLIYEPYLAERQRGPDFGVTFKTHTSFTVEVRRLHPSAADADLRLAAVFTDKLRQLPPATANVLALKSDGEHIIAPEHIQTALSTLATLAQRRDDDACRRRGFEHAHDLSRHLERLSAVAVLAPSAVLYKHPRARHALSPDLRKALARALA